MVRRGGGLEYFQRSPGSHRRLRTGNGEPESITGPPNRLGDLVVQVGGWTQI
jgi:hypothetical protein